MAESSVDLAVGETLHVGAWLVTIVDIDGDDVRVRVDPAGGEESDEDSGDRSPSPR